MGGLLKIALLSVCSMGFDALYGGGLEEQVVGSCLLSGCRDENGDHPE